MGGKSSKRTAVAIPNSSSSVSPNFSALSGISSNSNNSSVKVKPAVSTSSASAAYTNLWLSSHSQPSSTVHSAATRATPTSHSTNATISSSGYKPQVARDSGVAFSPQHPPPPISTRPRSPVKSRDSFGHSIFSSRFGEDNTERLIRLQRAVNTERLIPLQRSVSEISSGEITFEIEIERRFHGYFIGKNGQGVKKLNEKYSVKINFPKRYENSDTVEIVGNRYNITLCKQHMLTCVTRLRKTPEKKDCVVEKLRNGFLNNTTLDNEYEESFLAWSYLKGEIIGKDGWKLHKVQKEKSVRVELKGHDDNFDKIVLRGRRVDVANARKTFQNYEIVSVMSIPLLKPRYSARTPF